MESISFPLQSEFAHAFAREWIDAWNSLDLERILSHYSDNVTLISPVAVQRMGNGTVQGKAALRDYFRTGIAKNPDFRFDLAEVFWGVETVALVDSSSFRTARTIEVMQLAPSGLVQSVWANYNE